mgnify:CR=1 FL=1
MNKTHAEIFLETLQQLTRELRDLRQDIFDLHCTVRALRAEKISQESKKLPWNLKGLV